MPLWVKGGGLEATRHERCSACRLGMPALWVSSGREPPVDWMVGKPLLGKYNPNEVLCFRTCFCDCQCKFWPLLIESSILSLLFLSFAPRKLNTDRSTIRRWQMCQQRVNGLWSAVHTFRFRTPSNSTGLLLAHPLLTCKALVVDW